MNKLMNALTNNTVTTNGMRAYKSTLSAVLDLFKDMGAARNMHEDKFKKLVTNAAKEDLLATLRLVFYLGDVREGLGERDAFKKAIAVLAEEYPESLAKNVQFIPEFTRWDNILILQDTALEPIMLEEIQKGFAEGNPLMAKWLPRTDVSSKARQWQAVKLAKDLKMSFQNYNAKLKELRAELKLIETQLTQRNYAEINLEKVPTRALMKYLKALKTNIPEEVDEYFENLKEGNVKRVVKTAFPYEVIRNFSGNERETMWAKLPDLFEGNYESILPVIDSSGSMTFPISRNSSVTCYDVAVSLGIYIAQRNQGPFKNGYVDFARYSNFSYLNGTTLNEHLGSFSGAVGNTNIQGVYKTLLKVAKETGATQEDMPKKLLILSDMQFDEGSTDASQWSTCVEDMQESYSEAGYEMPEVVFWNLNGDTGNTPITVNDAGVAEVSGFSPNILKTVLTGNPLDPMEPIREIVTNDRYSVINI